MEKITMTPKEKAINLVAQFTSKWFGNSVEANTYVIENIPIYGSFDQFSTAKECAIIAVDEILYVIQNLYFMGTVQYWQEVKNEIEKL
jgi:hypothetical protein